MTPIPLSPISVGVRAGGRWSFPRNALRPSLPHRWRCRRHRRPPFTLPAEIIAATIGCAVTDGLGSSCGRFRRSRRSAGSQACVACHPAQTRRSCILASRDDRNTISVSRRADVCIRGGCTRRGRACQEWDGATSGRRRRLHGAAAQRSRSGDAAHTAAGAVVAAEAASLYSAARFAAYPVQAGRQQLVRCEQRASRLVRTRAHTPAHETHQGPNDRAEIRETMATAAVHRGQAKLKRCSAWATGGVY